jgi:hypothetical protein
VSGSHHRPTCCAASLVLRKRERHRFATVGRAALAGELPALRTGLDALEPAGDLVHVGVDLRQEIRVVRLLLVVVTGHGITSPSSLDRVATA